MAEPITTLGTITTLEQQLFLILEKFSDLQLGYTVSFPTSTPIQVLTAYTRDHLTGVMTFSATMESETVQNAATGEVKVVPLAYDFAL
jgi:hypothetical protein